jgi:hypothetical protein|nr:MAG TPA: tail sheath protein [Caudoviricetes sp.]
MANLDRIVNVQISLNTTGISKDGFSTMLIVGASVHTLARVETYTDANAMIKAGYTADDPLYLAAVDAFSQTPRPKVVKIGRRLVDSVKIKANKVTAAGVYTVTVSTKDKDGNVSTKPYTITNTGGHAADIATALQTKVKEDTKAAVTATVSGDELTLTGKSGGSFKVEVSSMLTMENGAVTETIPQTMTAICTADNDWYGWTLASRAEEDVIAAAEWTEAQRKLFGTSSAADGIIDADVTNDIGSRLMEGNFYRSFYFYHADAAKDFPECAVMARCFATYPGGETWANKKLAGVTTDGLTETQYNAITKKNGNTFERFRNVTITQNGKVAAGEWIDVIRFRDWLQEEMTVNIFNVLINNDKVPYTDAGIALVEAQMRAALKLGQTRGGIAPDEYDENGNTNAGYVVSAPLAANISANTKATRVLDDMRFTARLAGAIHAVEIKGSLTYENLITA